VLQDQHYDVHKKSDPERGFHTLALLNQSTFTE